MNQDNKYTALIAVALCAAMVLLYWISANGAVETRACLERYSRATCNHILNR